MSKESKILNLSSNLADDVQLFDLRSIDNLDRHRVSRQLMIGFYSTATLSSSSSSFERTFHLAETARAECFVQDVMSDANDAHIGRRIVRRLTLLLLSFVLVLEGEQSTGPGRSPTPPPTITEDMIQSEQIGIGKKYTQLELRLSLSLVVVVVVPFFFSTNPRASPGDISRSLVVVFYSKKKVQRSMFEVPGDVRVVHQSNDVFASENAFQASRTKV